MNFFQTSDWHLHDYHPYESDGVRLGALDRNIGLVIKYATKKIKNPLIVVAGDIFHTDNPTRKLISILTRRVRQGKELGVVWRFVPGNHDTDGIEGALDMLSDLDEDIFINKPRREIVDGVNVVYVPWERNIQDAIIEARKMRRKNLFNILFTHCSSSDALSDTGYRMRNSEVSSSVFKGWDYVGLGDYHLPQWVKKGRVAYSGSILKFNWGERNHNKSFIFGTVTDMKIDIKRVKLPDIEFIQIDLEENSVDEFLSVGYLGAQEMLGALVQVRIHAPHGTPRLGSILLAVKRKIQDNGAWKVFVSWKTKGVVEIGTDGKEEGIELDIESACKRNLEHNGISDNRFLNYIREKMKYETI